MSSGSGSSTRIWTKLIQWCGKKVRMVLKVTVEELGWSSNRSDNILAQMGHGGLVSGSSNLELLPDFCQLKDHCFGFIVHRRN